MEPQIGKLIPNGSNALRDAIHVAIFPALAAEYIEVGDYVYIDKFGKAYREDRDKAHGIMDPFLEYGYVHTGDQFWVFLFPNTVTGMRHQWSHSQLNNAVEPKTNFLKPITATPQESNTPKVINDIDDIIDPNVWSCCSQVDIDGGWPWNGLTDVQDQALRRICEFADKYYVTPSKLIDAAVSGNTLCFGTEVYSEEPFVSDLRDFWANLSIFTGIFYDDDHRDRCSYRCAC